MKTSTTYSEPMLSSLLFCSALGAWVLSGCSAKLDGYVPMGGDTGGSTSLQNTLIGGNGSGGTTSASGSTVVSDPSSLSTGESNQVSTGGYWWTYTDHQSVITSHWKPNCFLKISLMTVSLCPHHSPFSRLYDVITALAPASMPALNGGK